MRRHLPSCIAALILPLSSACSGASTAIFLPPGTHDSGSTSSGSSGGSSSGGGFDATPDSESFGPGSDSGGTDDSSSGSGLDGASDAMTEGGDAADAARLGPVCPQSGQTSHCPSGEICCLTTAVLTTTATCQSATCTGTPVSCSSQADCPPNQVCCGTETTNVLTRATSYQDVACATTCTSGTLGVPARVQFCEPGDTCPSATSCQTSTIVQGYTVCR